MYSNLIRPMPITGELDWLRNPVVNSREVRQMSLLEHYLGLAHLAATEKSDSGQDLSVNMDVRQSDFLNSAEFGQNINNILGQFQLIDGDVSRTELVNSFYLFGLIEGLASPFHGASQLCLHVLGVNFSEAANQFSTIKQNKYPGNINEVKIHHCGNDTDYTLINTSYHLGVSHREGLNPGQVKTLFPYRAPVNQDLLSWAINNPSPLVLISLVFPSNAFAPTRVPPRADQLSVKCDNSSDDSCFGVFGI